MSQDIQNVSGDRGQPEHLGEADDRPSSDPYTCTLLRGQLSAGYKAEHLGFSLGLYTVVSLTLFLLFYNLTDVLGGFTNLYFLCGFHSNNTPTEIAKSFQENTLFFRTRRKQFDHITKCFQTNEFIVCDSHPRMLL